MSGNPRLRELLAAAKRAKATGTTNLAAQLVDTSTSQHTGMHGEVITYNPKQQSFVDIASSGKSCVLLGPAGTGKTTSTQGAISELIAQPGFPILQGGDHKYLPKEGTPGIVISAFTRRATNNIRKVLPDNLKGNCVTIHKLLEYQPVEVYVTDPETGEEKRSMRFEPARNRHNPLPVTIQTIVIEEASMLGTDLFEKLLAALSHSVQFIFIGDIQQLPPVFGPAILGFAMLALPVVTLTEVYRQALDSPIIRLAHQILSGKPIPPEAYPDWKVDNKLTLHPFKKKLLPEHATQVLAAFFKQGIDTGLYEPEEDMILIPYNKACGTEELNRHIANHLARVEMRVTHELIAGFNKLYFSEGDKVLYDKEDATIISIKPNSRYTGARYQAASQYLDYWGTNQDTSAPTEETTYDDDVDFLLSQVAAEKSEDRVTQASHTLRLHMADSNREVEVSSASELNSLLHAYALTVHKSQGSEWRKVFLCFHHSHATMLARELLYTAVTRAREELYCICEPETFTKGIISQRIKGDTMEEKAEHFKGKRDNKEHNYAF